jgi:phosphatidylinositol-3-phosphatase
VAAVLIGAGLISGCAGGSGTPAVPVVARSVPSVPPASTPGPSPSIPAYSKVLVIAEENKTYDQVLTSGRAPYLTKLAARYASAQAMDAGYPPHAPVPYYAGERERCRRWNLPLGTRTRGALHDDLAAGTLSAYSFVTPNACNDMHGASGCGPDQVATGDAWLARWVPRILAGPDYRAGRLVVITTWDEGSRTDNHIATLVLAPTATQPSVRQPLTHCSMLRLSEEMLRLPLLGCAADVPSPRAYFRLG